MGRLTPILASLGLLTLPSLALASAEAHGASLKEQGYYLINFLVFAGLLWLLLKDRLAGAWATRRAGIKTELEQAALTLDQAHQREEEAQRLQRQLPEELASWQARETRELAAIEEVSARRLAKEQQRLEAAHRASQEFERRQQTRRLRARLALQTLDETERLLKAGLVPVDRVGQNQAFLNDLAQLPTGRLEVTPRTGEQP
jgi:F0F1-type ATP synthase membrane subunit b/b'